MFTNKSSNKQTANLIRKADLDRQFTAVQGKAVETGNDSRVNLDVMTTIQRLKYLRSLGK